MYTQEQILDMYFERNPQAVSATIVSANRVSFAPYICEVALTACGLRWNA